jgi:HPt (histidine-containing phosphotransfer) domain-containing protein
MNYEISTKDHYAGIDMELVNELMEVLEEGFVELLDIFLEDTPQQIDGMASAIEKGDLEGIRSYAHILNGSCSNFGTYRIDQLLNAIRDVCKTVGDDRPTLIGLLGDVRREYDVVAQSLRTLRSTLIAS